ncbi:hypothetical protein B0J18DRAFT_430434 [Chaetomium sp. MPI-SDFR-AT-0129]|nr:hypothetical protein B0J18DRAFT_430434 [Chaetomium sp. MPI-SDFR-AT-0129]
MGRAREAEAVYGIREIYRPPPPLEPEVDIVAVHGLNGSALGTWTTVDSGICWLSDPQFLPRYVLNARVLVWGYNGSFSSLTGADPSQDRIHDHAHTLVEDLSTYRKLSGTADKPIIFLCHSLGGIVVKRALCYAQTRTGPKVAHEHAIFTHTYGILFFGTPHHGTSKATWLAYLKLAGAAATLGMASRRSDLVAALEHESETLQNITDFFVPLTPQFRIFYFWEQKKTYMGWSPKLKLKLGLGLRSRRIATILSSSSSSSSRPSSNTNPNPASKTTTTPALFTLDLGKAVFIVPPTSAAPPQDDGAERAGIAADHRGMVRFETPADQGFRMVADALVRYCADAVEKMGGAGGGAAAASGKGGGEMVGGDGNL